MTGKMTSELSAPLGRRRARAEKAQAGKSRRHLPVARLAFAGIAVLLVAVTLRMMQRRLGATMR